MSAIERMIEFVENRAAEFGAKSPRDSNRSYILRKNVGDDAINEGDGYVGIIQPDEETSGPYHDLSLTINPTLDEKPWHVNICVGLAGFKNDYELAARPGPRRLFSRLVDSEGYCKSNFSDTESALPKAITTHDDFLHFQKAFKTYSKLYCAIQLLRDPEGDENKKRISAFLAAYARLRDWPTNKQHRTAIDDALAPFIKAPTTDIEQEVRELVLERRFVILEGPPGTGKTRLAKKLALSLEAETFFTQFHAETNYSDFIYGIRPNVDDKSLGYVDNDGIFAKALHFAIKNPEHRTLLVVDEINRANLSNVLGPVFYLFEHKLGDANVELEVTPKLSISQLPPNLFVVGTMNTADRSLAVVDFALRRRFAWYSLKPAPVDNESFYKDDFAKIAGIFELYATSDELSLQPGQGYFLAASDDEMSRRLNYEVFPLIKEYLREGLILSAREDFNEYFTNRIGKSLYE